MKILLNKYGLNKERGLSPLSLFIFIRNGIFMYHYVFYFLIPLLDGIVYALGDGVRFEKAYRAVNADLGVDIYLAAESAGLQLIHAPHAVLLR